MTEAEAGTSNAGYEHLARWMDSKFVIPGTRIRFGLDALIGLIPGLGDWLTGIISFYFVIIAVKMGGGSAILLRMFFNILLDITVGSIPLVGDLFDVSWKANLKNARLLNDLKADRTAATGESRWFNWLAVMLFFLVILSLLWIIALIVSAIAGLF